MEAQADYGTNAIPDPNNFSRNEYGEFDYPEDVRRYNRNGYAEDPPDSYYGRVGIPMGETGMFCVPLWSKEHGESKKVIKTLVNISFLRAGRQGLLSAGVLNAVAHNLKELNDEVPNPEMVAAIEHIYQAVALLQKRQEDRKARGVFGTKEA